MTDPALRVRDLQLRFGGQQVLDHVSFELPHRSTVGLIGPNGAGKTSVLNSITGFYPVDGGTIEVEGLAVHGAGTARIAASGVARTFQHAETISAMGARDLVLLGLHRSMPAGVLRYALRRATRRAEHDANERVEQIAAELGITDEVRANTVVGSLPYGTRKLVDLGRALVSRPALLLLDEPGAGLAPSEKSDITEVLRRQMEDRRPEERPLAVVVIDHDIAFVTALCDRLLVLDAGRLLADGPHREVLSDPAVIEAYVGVPTPPRTETT